MLVALFFLFLLVIRKVYIILLYYIYIILTYCIMSPQRCLKPVYMEAKRQNEIPGFMHFYVSLECNDYALLIQIFSTLTFLVCK